MTAAADPLIGRFDHPETPNRTHTPELERWAYNQMPKGGWRDLKLFRFDGSDLFQWWGKRGKDSAAHDWSPFEDSATDVFAIRARATHSAADAEVERWISAYQIAHDQAAENGAEAARLKRREADLLETTNRYLMRARAAEALRIVAAAHRIDLTPEGSGDPRAVTVIISAPPPARHANLFAIQPDGPYPAGEESGFLLSDGTFATRKEAMKLALANGQLAAPTRSDELFSEDLW